MGKGEAFGLDRIVSGINVVLRETSGLSSGILLETTARQGSNLGYTFQQIGYILQRVVFPERVSVCFDTCHAYAAGYDIKNKKELTEDIEKRLREALTKFKERFIVEE